MGHRPRLARLDLCVLGASPEKLAARQEIPAIDAPALDDNRRQLLYRLNYRNRGNGTPLSTPELILRARLEQISRGGK
jgi:hypothetical protein